MSEEIRSLSCAKSNVHFCCYLIVAAVDAKLAFTVTSTVSHLTAEPHALPPSKCVESLLCGIPQQIFPNAYST